MAKILIRFNTKFAESADTSLKWRVLIDGVERLARQVRVETPCETIEEAIASGETKWHIGCSGKVHWDGAIATVRKD